MEKFLGHIYAEVKLYNRDKSKKISILVDTGSTFTWIKEKTLKELGIVPIDKSGFKKIDGTTIIREIGEVVMEIEDRKRTTIVVFGKDSDTEVLGLYSLEGLGFDVDARAKKLKKVSTHLAVRADPYGYVSQRFKDLKI